MLLSGVYFRSLYENHVKLRYKTLTQNRQKGPKSRPFFARILQDGWKNLDTYYIRLEAQFIGEGPCKVRCSYDQGTTRYHSKRKVG